MLNNKFHNCFFIIASTLCFGIGMTTKVIAATCPTHLKQDPDGFWFSHDEPGWKSRTTTKTGLTIDANDFGGAVYSPKTSQLVCVYQASNKKWIALLSVGHDRVKLQKKMSRHSNQKFAWKYDRQHLDYSCGQPEVNSLSSCAFSLRHKR